MSFNWWKTAAGVSPASLQPPEMIQRDNDIRQWGIKAGGNDAEFGINKAWRHVITKHGCIFIHILFNYTLNCNDFLYQKEFY